MANWRARVRMSAKKAKKVIMKVNTCYIALFIGFLIFIQYDILSVQGRQVWYMSSDKSSSFVAIIAKKTCSLFSFTTQWFNCIYKTWFEMKLVSSPTLIVGAYSWKRRLIFELLVKNWDILLLWNCSLHKKKRKPVVEVKEKSVVFLQRYFLQRYFVTDYQKI